MSDRFDIDSDKLIAEVKKRPAIYNCSLVEHKDRALKNCLWSQVCENVVPNWSGLGSREKFTRGREVQKEWKMLLMSFQRELYRHARDKFVRGRKMTNRKYHFLNKMKFLLSTANTESLQQFMGESGSTKSKSRQTSRECMQCKRKSSSMERQNLIYDIDDDKAFLLSLLPTLKKLRADQKFMARINIMNTIIQMKEMKEPKLIESLESFVKNKSIDNISIYSLSQNHDRCIEIFKQKELEQGDKGDFKLAN